MRNTLICTVGTSLVHGLCIQTTGRNLAETNTIALYLKEKYAQ